MKFSISIDRHKAIDDAVNSVSNSLTEMQMEAFIGKLYCIFDENIVLEFDTETKTATIK